MAAGVDAQQRFITRPVAGTIRVAVNGVEQTSGWLHLGGGRDRVSRRLPHERRGANGRLEFDVPVRFAEDSAGGQPRDLRRGRNALGAAGGDPRMSLADTILAQDLAALAFCWRLERRDGVTIGLTSHDPRSLRDRRGGL
jgi:hypothetical protein